MKTLFDAADVASSFDHLVSQIASAFGCHEHINVVGIRTRGSILANRMVARLRQTGFTLVDHGVIDVTMYRDDIRRLGPRPVVGPTRLDLDVDGKPLLLVDDVLWTGRTMRAAMDAIADFGRPASLRVATLVDRGGREVPISADFVGLSLKDVPVDRRINVRLRELDGKDNITIESPAERSDDAAAGQWRHRHLIGLEELTADEIRFVLDTADSFKEVSTRSVKKVPALRGRVVVNAFFEDSTRTRTSFSLAAQRLSADLIDFSEHGSSASKGETLVDTARNIEAMGVDIIVLRHKAAGAAQLLARTIRTASIVNAGDGAHEHPTQGLLDLYTLRERFGRDFAGLKVAIVGDIANSRVARSDLWGLTKLGAQVILVGPPTLLPKSFEQLGARVCHNFDEVIGEVDAIQMLRVQNERMKAAQFPTVREFTHLFGLTWDRFQRCKKGVFVMHPGPMNRGVEIQSDIADGDQSGILKQVTNGLAVRMAVLYLVSQVGT
jgi:aspartate carbamoyltransferase catalytic subunit